MIKKSVIVFGVILGLFVIVAFSCNIFGTKSELLGNIELFKNDKENKVVGEVVNSEETLNLKDIEDKKELIVANIEEDVVIIDTPVVVEKENKEEITKTEIKDIQKIENKNVTSVKVEKPVIKDEFVKFERNDKVIATIQAKIFSLVPTEWLFGNNKVVVDSDGIDENTEYVTLDQLSKDLLNNKSGDIKIFAYDKIWNNGTDYVLRTRCYIR